MREDRLTIAHTYERHGSPIEVLHRRFQLPFGKLPCTCTYSVLEVIFDFLIAWAIQLDPGGERLITTRSGKLV